MSGLVVTIVLFLVGVFLIVKGGDIFVDAATWMAEASGIPKFVIGATVVSLATTLPEIIVSFLAAAQGKVDMAIGNAIGSVTANTGLILGIALLCMPHVISRKELMPKAIMMLSAAAIIALFGLSGQLGIIPGVLLLIIFVLSLWENIHCAKTSILKPAVFECANGDTACLTKEQAEDHEQASVKIKHSSKELTINIVKFVVGAIGIVLGAKLLVDNGSALALELGVPERIIAVSVIAIGTSLPELVTTITAIAKKHSALSVGNIIGANIIDLAIILPISSLLAKKPLPVSSQLAHIDLPACLLISAVALIPTLITKKFSRVQGFIMVALYVAYIIITTAVVV